MSLNMKSVRPTVTRHRQVGSMPTWGDGSLREPMILALLWPSRPEHSRRSWSASTWLMRCCVGLVRVRVRVRVRLGLGWG